MAPSRRSLAAMTMAAAVAALALPLASAVPSFVIDLDAPPEDRWLEVVDAYKNLLPGLMSTYGTWLQHIPQDEKAQWLLHHNIDEELVRELRGIASAADHAEVTIDRLLLFQLIYELQFPTFCGGVLAATQNGTVIHGRNMDYSIVFKANGQQHSWMDITFEADFRKGNQTLFKSVSWLGHIGIHTALRPGGWSFEQNTRHLNDRIGNLAEARVGGKPFLPTARRIMEEVADFNEAVRRLEAQHWMAPMYFVLSGAQPYEGAVLTIDRKAHTQPYTNALTLSPQIGRWFLVQTNDDLAERPPASDPRRAFGEELMSARGQASISITSIQRTMRTPPIFNKDTVFTWVAVPSTGYFRTWLRGEPLNLLVLESGASKVHRK